MIQTFKTHFIMGLYSVEPLPPFQHWDNLVEQSKIILNITWASRTKLKILAYMKMFCGYDYNTTSVALTGTKVVTYNKI